MKILLSASACSSRWGSEPGVGWRWANELARDHEVIVLTHRFFESHLSDGRYEVPRNLSFRYLSIPVFGMSERVYLNSRLYYVAWQVACLFHCLRTGLHREVDVIHHLTLGTFRFPSFLGLLGKPFVMGPVGGGERAPMRLFSSLPFRDRCVERVRALAILMSKIDPGVWINCLSAKLILCKTEESRQALPSRFWNKCKVRQEIGVEAEIAPVRERGTQGPLRAFFAGRLIGWKGAHLAIAGVAKARRRGVDVTLTLAGEGRLDAWLVAQAQREGIAQHVHFLGNLERSTLLNTYAQMDVFVFPSLHDSSGNVVLEAMRAGLPVICLDLGGPKYFVSDDVGFVVKATAMSESQIPHGIADALVTLANDRTMLDSMSERATIRRHDFLWEKQVHRSYRDIGEVLDIDGVKPTPDIL